TDASFTAAIVEVDNVEMFRDEVPVNDVRDSETAVLDRPADRLHLLDGEGYEIYPQLRVTPPPPAQVNVGSPDASRIKNCHVTARTGEVFCQSGHRSPDPAVLERADDFVRHDAD